MHNSPNSSVSALCREPRCTGATRHRCGAWPRWACCWLLILIEGFRRDRAAALLAVLPILLLEFASFGPYLLTTFHIPTTFFPFGLGINTGNIASMLMLLVIGALALRRFVRTQVGQEVTAEGRRIGYGTGAAVAAAGAGTGGDRLYLLSPSKPSTVPRRPSAAISSRPSPGRTAACWW